MKDAKALVGLLLESGFTLARAKNHQVWRCPCGHRSVTVAGTSGGGRGTTNARLEMKRTLRACRTPQEETTS